jgi:hypothetical protein
VAAQAQAPAPAPVQTSGRGGLVWLGLGGLTLLAIGAALIAGHMHQSACISAAGVGTTCASGPNMTAIVAAVAVIVVLVGVGVTAVVWTRQSGVGAAVFAAFTIVVPVAILALSLVGSHHDGSGIAPSSGSSGGGGPASGTHSASYEEGMASARSGPVHQDIVGEKQMGGVDMSVDQMELDRQVRSIAAAKPDDYVTGCEDFLENRTG